MIMKDGWKRIWKRLWIVREQYLTTEWENYGKPRDLFTHQPTVSKRRSKSRTFPPKNSRI
jgi:hypothetical protein